MPARFCPECERPIPEDSYLAGVCPHCASELPGEWKRPHPQAIAEERTRAEVRRTRDEEERSPLRSVRLSHATAGDLLGWGGYRASLSLFLSAGVVVALGASLGQLFHSPSVSPRETFSQSMHAVVITLTTGIALACLIFSYYLSANVPESSGARPWSRLCRMGATAFILAILLTVYARLSNQAWLSDRVAKWDADPEMRWTNAEPPWSEGFFTKARVFGAIGFLLALAFHLLGMAHVARRFERPGLAYAITWCAVLYLILGGVSSFVPKVWDQLTGTASNRGTVAALILVAMMLWTVALTGKVRGAIREALIGRDGESGPGRREARRSEPVESNNNEE